MKNTKKKISKSTPQVKKFSIFDWLKEVSYNKNVWSGFSEEQKKTFDPFMLNRFLSMNEDYIELINYISFIPLNEKEKYYRIYCDLLPKKQFWSKYIKSTKKQPNKELIKYLTIYFECGSEEVTEYIELLDSGKITECLIDMGLEIKTIKTLLK